MRHILIIKNILKLKYASQNLDKKKKVEEWRMEDGAVGDSILTITAPV